VIYIVIGAVLTGMVPSKDLGTAADPLAYALKATGMAGIAKIVALGAVFSMAAVLLVFQYGQPRIFFAMARDGLLPRWASKIHGKYRTPYITTILTGVFVALWSLIGDAGETYDLTNIGTLFAFALVCTGVIVLRYTDPSRHRPFRVPFVHVVGIVGAGLCIFVMQGLPHLAWVRFGWWLVIGLALYVVYGYGHSTLRRGSGPVPIEPPPPMAKA
jgi:APA family basic amino acid/polyamine antiporter